MENEDSHTPKPTENQKEISVKSSAAQRSGSDSTEIENNSPEAGPSGVTNNASSASHKGSKNSSEIPNHDIDASGSSSSTSRNSKKRKKVCTTNTISMRRSKRLKADAEKQAQRQMLISMDAISINNSNLTASAALPTSEDLHSSNHHESNEIVSVASNSETNGTRSILIPEQNSVEPNSNFNSLTYAEVPSFILPNLAETHMLQSLSDNNSDHVFQASVLNPDLSALELDPTGSRISHHGNLISNEVSSSDHMLQSSALIPGLGALGLDPAGGQTSQPGSLLSTENLFLGTGQHAPGVSSFFVTQAELNNSPEIATIDVVTETVTGSAADANVLPQLLTATPLTLSPADDPLEQQYLKNNTNTTRVNEILSSIEVPAFGKRMQRGHLRKTGDYLLGPCLGSSPVHSIVQCLARKINTDEFYTLKILTIHESDVENQDDRQGKMLLHTEHSLLSMLADHPGVIRMHALFQDYSYEVVRRGSVFFQRNLFRRQSGMGQESSGTTPPTPANSTTPRRDSSARSGGLSTSSPAAQNNRGSAFSAMNQSRANRIHSTTRSRRSTSSSYPSASDRSRSTSNSAGSSGQRSTAPDTRSLRSGSGGVRDAGRLFAVPSSRFFHHHRNSHSLHHRSNAVLVNRPSSRRGGGGESGVADWRVPRASARYRRTLHNILDSSYTSGNSRFTRFTSMLQRSTASSLSSSGVTVNSSSSSTGSSTSGESVTNASAALSTGGNNNSNGSSSSAGQVPVFRVPRVPPVTRRNSSAGGGGSSSSGGGSSSSGGESSSSSSAGGSSSSSREGSSSSGRGGGEGGVNGAGSEGDSANQNSRPEASRNYRNLSRRIYRDMDGVYTGRVVRRLCLVLDCVTPHDFSSKTDHLINLQHYVIARQALPEADALAIFYNAAEIVHSLHEVNIVHRDLKLGNLVVEHATHKVTLTNLCLGQHLMPNMPKLQDQRGSPAYISPDVLSAHPYRGKPSDMWALGVVLFTMLYGHFPFYDKVPHELFKKIRAAKFNIPRELPVSESTVELIHGLLHPDPDARFTSRRVLTFLTTFISSRAVLDVLRLSPPPQVVPDIDDKLKEAVRNRLRRFPQSTSTDGTPLPGSLGSLFFPISPPPTPLLPQVPRGVLHHYNTGLRSTAGHAGVYPTPPSQPPVPVGAAPSFSSPSATSSILPSSSNIASQPSIPAAAAENIPPASSPPLLLEGDRSQQRLHHRLQQLQIIPPNRVLLSSANPDELQVVPDIVDSRAVPRGNSSSNSNVRGVPGSPNPIYTLPHHLSNSNNSSNSRFTSISFSPFTPLSTVATTASSNTLGPGPSLFRTRTQHPLLRGQTVASLSSSSSAGILHTVPSAQSPTIPDLTNGVLLPSRSISLSSTGLPLPSPFVPLSAVDTDPEISRNTLLTRPSTTPSLSSAFHHHSTTETFGTSPPSILNSNLLIPLASSTSNSDGFSSILTTASSSPGFNVPNFTSSVTAHDTPHRPTASVTAMETGTQRPPLHFLQSQSLLLNNLDGESYDILTTTSNPNSDALLSEETNNLDNLIHAMRESRGNCGPPQPCHSHTNLSRAMAGNAFANVSREDASVLTVPPVVPTTLGLNFTRGAGQQGSLITRSYGDLTPLTPDQILAVRDLLPPTSVGGTETGQTSSLLPRHTLGTDNNNVLNRPASSPIASSSSLIYPNLSTDPLTAGPLWHRLNMNHRLSASPHLPQSWTYSGSTLGRPALTNSGPTVRTPTISLQSVRSPAASLSRLLIARRQQQNQQPQDARSFTLTSSVRNTSAIEMLQQQQQQQQQQLREAMFYYSSLNNSAQQGTSSTTPRSPNFITTNGLSHMVTSTQTSTSSVGPSNVATTREAARNQFIAGALSTLFAFSETSRAADPDRSNSSVNGSSASPGINLSAVSAAQASTTSSSFARFSNDAASDLRNTARSTINLSGVYDGPSISRTSSASTEQLAVRSGIAAINTASTTSTDGGAGLVSSSSPTISYSSLNSATSRLRARRNARASARGRPLTRRSARATPTPPALEPLMLGLFSSRTAPASVGQRRRREASSNLLLCRRGVLIGGGSEISTAASILNSVGGNEPFSASSVSSAASSGIAATSNTTSISVANVVDNSTPTQSYLEHTLSDSESTSD